jgi:hypothetical protein
MTPGGKKKTIFDRPVGRPARVEPKHSAHEIVTKHLTFYNMSLKNASNFL